jgi:hypothetical protein
MALESRQLSILLHGNLKRLIKATTDLTAPQRVLRLLASWASAHALIDTSTFAIISVSHVLCEEFEYTRGGLLGASIASLSGPGTASSSLRNLVRRVSFIRKCLGASAVFVRLAALSH